MKYEINEEKLEEKGRKGQRSTIGSPYMYVVYIHLFL